MNWGDAMNKKAIIAMSGGVDSSVAAYLMKKQGYDCMGVTMKLFHNEDIGIPQTRSCCSLDDVEDARNVAYELGIPYYVLNFSERFEEDVIERFVAAYAHIEKDVSSGRYLLKKALDSDKDQSYVLYALTQEQLAHTQFPLGDMTKHEVCRIAESQRFINAHKHDSQDICFVRNGSYADFIEGHTGNKYPEGNFIDCRGNILGRHHGIIRYTIGQRKGLELSFAEPMYVCEIDSIENTITLGKKSELYSSVLIAKDITLIPFSSIEIKSKSSLSPAGTVGNRYTNKRRYAAYRI